MRIALIAAAWAVCIACTSCRNRPKYEPTLETKVVEGRTVGADDTFVYWSEEGRGIWRRPKKGAEGAGTLVVDAKLPLDFLVDSWGVYWVERDTGRLLEAPRAGGDATVLLDHLKQPRLVAQDEEGIYLLTAYEQSGALAGQTGGRITRLAKHAESATTIVYTGATVSAAAVDAIWLYVGATSSGAGNQLIRVPRRGGALEPICGTGLVRDVVMGKDVVYWSEFGPPGRIRAVPKGGGDASTLVDLGKDGVGGYLAMRAETLYYTTIEDGSARVYRRDPKADIGLLAVVPKTAIMGMAEGGARVYVLTAQSLLSVPNE